MAQEHDHDRVHEHDHDRRHDHEHPHDHFFAGRGGVRAVAAGVSAAAGAPTAAALATAGAAGGECPGAPSERQSWSPCATSLPTATK